MPKDATLSGQMSAGAVVVFISKLFFVVHHYYMCVCIQNEINNEKNKNTKIKLLTLSHD
jgi:hypothetical protein